MVDNNLNVQDCLSRTRRRLRDLQILRWAHLRQCKHIILPPKVLGAVRGRRRQRGGPIL